MRRLFYITGPFFFLFSSCTAGTSQKEGNDSFNPADSIALIEQEIQKADSIRIASEKTDTASNDSIPQDSLPKTSSNKGN